MSSRPRRRKHPPPPAWRQHHERGQRAKTSCGPSLPPARTRHLAIHARRGYVTAAVASLWREAQRAVEPNDFAVEVIVFDDALHEGAVFGRPAHPLGERDLRAPIGLELVACLAISGSQESAGGDGDDANAERGQVAS